MATDGSVNIIFSFGWAGSPGRLILFPIELKAADRGTFCQRRALAELKWQKLPQSAAFVLIGLSNCASIDRKHSKMKLYLQYPYCLQMSFCCPEAIVESKWPLKPYQPLIWNQHQHACFPGDPFAYNIIWYFQSNLFFRVIQYQDILRVPKKVKSWLPYIWGPGWISSFLCQINGQSVPDWPLYSDLMGTFLTLGKSLCAPFGARVMGAGRSVRRSGSEPYKSMRALNATQPTQPESSESRGKANEN